MAKIEILEPRDQEAHFGLYRTRVGGDEAIFVRRKVGDPTDYMHSRSRKVARQREYLALASKHYASLTPSQKAITRHQFEEIEFIASHGKSDTKLLTGRQLFIAKDIKSLAGTGKLQTVPYEACIILVDINNDPIDGDLWLYCTVADEWFDFPREELAPGNWLFTKVSPVHPPYKVYGEAVGYLDPKLPEHQAMSFEEIKDYHYHVLTPGTPPWGLPHTYYYYSCWGSYISHRFRSTEQLSYIYVRTKITSQGFSGALTIGIKEVYEPYLSPIWITRKELNIELEYYETAYYFTVLPAYLLAPNRNYNLVVWMMQDETPSWWGYNIIWKIPHS